jgi:hypothetical protein
MRLLGHALASVAVSTGIYGLTKSTEIAVSSFLAGVLIDIDHYFDYWLQYPLKLDVKHFFTTCEGHGLQRVTLLLHSVEMLLVLLAAVYLTRSKMLLGIYLGFSQHIIFDYIFNGVYPLSYYFVFRIINKFNNVKVFIIPDAQKTNG